MAVATRGRIIGVAYNGLQTGIGQQWHLQQIKGLDDMPDLQGSGSTDVALPGMDGMLFGEDREGKRVIELTMVAYGTGSSVTERQDQLSDAVQNLVAAFQRRPSDDLPLDITYQNSAGEQVVRSIFCRPRKRSVPLTTPNNQVTTTAVVTLEAQDPRVYGQELVASVGLSLGLGTRTYPRTYPWAYSAGGTGGIIQANNDGGRESYPVALIRGPVENPRIINREQAMFVQVNLSLSGSDSLLLDFWQRTITLNNSASRYYALSGTSDWFALEPGSNTIQFVGDFFQPAALLTLYWRSAD